MELKWYCCSHCDDVHSYEILGDITTFPRGEWLGHNKYITTGFNTEQEARAYLDKEQGRPPVEWHDYYVSYRHANGSGTCLVRATSKEDAKRRGLIEARRLGGYTLRRNLEVTEVSRS